MTTLDQLFDEWKGRDIHSNQSFIEDGPIDPERWVGVDKRVLFVAKEAYGEEGATTGWSLPKLVCEEWGGPKHKFWWTVGYWALAVRSTTVDVIPEFPGYRSQYDSTKTAVLESAVVNIKKSGGISSSDERDLKRYLESDGDLLLKQINFLDPHILIFCNTWDLVKGLFPGVEEVSQYIYVKAKTKKTQILIDYWHPANQYPNSVMFYALCALYQTSLRKLSWPELLQKT